MLLSKEKMTALKEDFKNQVSGTFKKLAANQAEVFNLLILACGPQRDLSNLFLAIS